jgi:hypothetical protein
MSPKPNLATALTDVTFRMARHTAAIRKQSHDVCFSENRGCRRFLWNLEMVKDGEEYIE